MLYGLVDVGSNSIRLSIYKYEEDKIKRLINKKEMVGLAGYVEDGALTQAGIDRTVMVLERFRAILLNYDVEEMHVFATASLRNIVNTQEVVDALERLAHVKVEVLSGSEEARLDYIGVSYFQKINHGILMDIGGGSTELVQFENNEAHKLTSMPIGSLNLYVNNVSKLLPNRKELNEIVRQIRKNLDNLGWEADMHDALLVGVGGTVRACLKISRELFNEPLEGEELSPSMIKRLVKYMKKGTVTNYRELYRIVPERMLTIIPGVLIFREVIRKFKPGMILVSGNGVREGYLIDRVLKIKVG